MSTRAATELFDNGHEFKSACLDTINQYSLRIDRGDSDGLAELFTDDGHLTISAGSFDGAEAIRNTVSAINGLPISLVHHITAHEIVQTSQTEGEGTVYLLVHMKHQANDETGTAEFTQINSGVYHDIYVLEEGVCKFKSRKLETFIETVVK